MLPALVWCRCPAQTIRQKYFVTVPLPCVIISNTWCYRDTNANANPKGSAAWSIGERPPLTLTLVLALTLPYPNSAKRENKGVAIWNIGNV